MNHARLRNTKIEADDKGNVSVPDRINILNAGKWTTPWHGRFEITQADLHQVVANAKAGIGLVEGSKRIPINYGHSSFDKAAGWFNADDLEVDGDSLWANSVTWTPAARQSLLDGEWRYLSPEFNPRSMPWENPQVEGEYVENVISGVALTNTPLFTKLTPVMASQDGSHGGSDTTKDNQGESMDLSQLRGKDLKDLTDDEKAFLAEHKAELTDDERTKFELVDAAADDEAAKAKAEEEAKAAAEAQTKAEADAKAAAEAEKVEASSKSVTIDASRLAKLEASAARADALAAKIAHDEATAVMASAVTSGRIKQDQQEAGISLLLADRDGKFKAFVEALPANEMLGKELGKGSAVEASAGTTLMQKAEEIVKASNGTVTLSQAVIQVSTSDPELANQYQTQLREGGN